MNCFTFVFYNKQIIKPVLVSFCIKNDFQIDGSLFCELYKCLWKFCICLKGSANSSDRTNYCIYDLPPEVKLELWGLYTIIKMTHWKKENSESSKWFTVQHYFLQQFLYWKTYMFGILKIFPHRQAVVSVNMFPSTSCTCFSHSS